MRTPTWCRQRAAQIGPACGQVIAQLLELNALFRLRAAQGVLGLADRHGPARLEAGCALAISVGDPSYRTIKGILVAGTEREPVARAVGDGGAAHLHGPTKLFANTGTTSASTGTDTSNGTGRIGNVIPLTTTTTTAMPSTTSTTSPPGPTLSRTTGSQRDVEEAPGGPAAIEGQPS